MDAPCKIQGSIHVFRLVNNMCPGKWVHIKELFLLVCSYCVKERDSDTSVSHRVYGSTVAMNALS